MEKKKLRYSKQAGSAKRIFVVFAALLLWATVFFDLPRLYAFSALAGGGAKIGIQKIPNALKNLGLERLGAENEELRARAAILEARLKEQEALGSLHTLEERPAKIATVLSIPPQSPYDVILIDAGRQDGIQPGEKVFAKSTLIGFVDEVGEGSAKVKLISYPELETEALLESLLLNITLEGYGGLNMIFIAPQDLEIKIGDRVISNTTPSYLIGEIGYIKSKESEALQTVYLRPPFNLRHLRFVEIRP